MSWFLRRASAVLALGALLAGCNGLDSTGHSAGSGDGKLTRGEPAPDASGEDAEGHPLRVSDFRGKVVMLSFWSTG
jgi:hypothetical protein